MNRTIGAIIVKQIFIHIDLYNIFNYMNDTQKILRKINRV